MSPKSNFSYSLKTIFWTISILYRSSPRSTIIYFISRGVREIKDLISVYVFARILNEIVLSVGRGEINYQRIYLTILAFFALEVFGLIFASFLRRYSEASINLLSEPKIRQIIYTKIVSLGIQSIENPEIANKITRSQESIRLIINLSLNALNVIAKLFSIAILLATVSVLNPIFTFLIVFLRAIGYYYDKKYRRRLWDFEKSYTESRRRAFANVLYLTTPSYLPEIIINHAFSFFDRKFIDVETEFAYKNLSLRRNYYATSYTIEFFSILSGVAIYCYTIFLLIAGKISVSLGLVQIRFLEKLDSAIQDTTTLFNDIVESVTRLEDIHYLLNATPAFKGGKKIFPKLTTGPAIEFNNVSFHYPDSKKFIFKNLNLTIRPGEKIAIVGHNGAGKTTLVKLLSRIYPIQQGEILVASKNLAEIKPETYYRNLGVLFQEYNNYGNLSPQDNIYVGRPDGKFDINKTLSSSKNADAHKFITKLSQGYNQILSERFKNGTRLSTGQWQKLAIARFFYRDAPILVFDEPTSSIDAVSESKIFSRIYKHFQNKTVIIISHRFSTVRSADKIIVMDNGQIVEEGTHQELLALNGRYAQSFNLQAKGYAQ